MEEIVQGRRTIKDEQREGTRAQILTVAERMFGACRYDGTSVRQIAAEAGLNLSLVLYHFRTKEGLYRAVFKRNAAHRHARIVHELAKGRCVTVSQVLMVLAESWLQLREEAVDGNALFSMGSMVDQSAREAALVKEFIDPSTVLLIEALSAAAPGRPRSEIHRTYHYFSGALVYFMTQEERIRRLSGSKVANIRTSLFRLARILETDLSRED